MPYIDLGVILGNPNRLLNSSARRPLANARPLNPHIILAILSGIAISVIFWHKMPQSINAGAYCLESTGITSMQGAL